jgi:hypothetical protein
MIDVPMPQLGESVAEGTVTKWVVREGDLVEREQVLLEVATDKADTEVRAPVRGPRAVVYATLTRRLLPELLLRRLYHNPWLWRPQPLLRPVRLWRLRAHGELRRNTAYPSRGSKVRGNTGGLLIRTCCELLKALPRRRPLW